MDILNSAGLADENHEKIKGVVNSKGTYEKPYNSWSLGGKKIVLNLIYLNHTEVALLNLFTESELFK